jgi:hypothetical protein
MAVLDACEERQSSLFQAASYFPDSDSLEYHQSRPHQGKNNQLLMKAKSRRKTEPPTTISIAKVRCEQKLGGLLKSYRWAA